MLNSPNDLGSRMVKQTSIGFMQILTRPLTLFAHGDGVAPLCFGLEGRTVLRTLGPEPCGRGGLMEGFSMQLPCERLLCVSGVPRSVDFRPELLLGECCVLGSTALGSHSTQQCLLHVM